MPNNNDITHVANIVLDEAYNNNDAMHSELCALNYHGHIPLNSQWGYITMHHGEKLTYQRREIRIF